MASFPQYINNFYLNASFNSRKPNAKNIFFIALAQIRLIVVIREYLKLISLNLLPKILTRQGFSDFSVFKSVSLYLY